MLLVFSRNLAPQNVSLSFPHVVPLCFLTSFLFLHQPKTFWVFLQFIFLLRLNCNCIFLIFPSISYPLPFVSFCMFLSTTFYFLAFFLLFSSLNWSKLSNLSTSIKFLSISLSSLTCIFFHHGLPGPSTCIAMTSFCVSK